MKTILFQQSIWALALIASPHFAHGFSWGHDQQASSKAEESGGYAAMSGFAAVASGSTTQQASSSGPVEGFSPDPQSTQDLEKLEYYSNHDSKDSMQTQSMTTETHSSVASTHQQYLASYATEPPVIPSAGFGPVTSSSSHSSSSTQGSAPNPPSTEELQKIEAKQKGSGTAASSMSSEAQAPVTHSSLNNTPHGDGNRRLRGGAVTEQRRLVQGCQGERKIVQCLDGVEEEECKAQLVAAGVEVVADMPKTEFFAICVDSQAEANLVAQLTEVAAIEDDPVRSPSVVAGSEVKRHLSSQQTPYGVNLVKAPEFWSQYGTTGEGKKICIIDSGLRRTHQDLKDIDDLTGATDSDLVTPWYVDGSSHGTHVAGTIAAQSNSVGVVGVAPGVAIHVVRVFDNYGYFSASGLVEAMNDCADADADVITMSLGGAVYNSAEATTATRLANQGILLVAASGNGADDDNAVNYPAAYSSVMSVGALNEDSEIASFSTHNSNVDIAGPGVSVLSTTSDSDYSYAEYDGTSMATPHVSAVAALLWSEFPNKSASQIRTALEKSATDVGACGKDRLFGHGLVNIMAAADYLERGVTAPELSGCTNVEVSLSTDYYGSETTYIITPKGDSENIVYRGGPYTDNHQTTYTDNFQLVDGCYSLTVYDSFGDGFSGSYGDGSLAVTYDGSTEVSYDDFTGSSETFEFGDCGGNDGGGSTGGELEVELYLTTDDWSRSENALYLFDDDAQDDEFLWYVPRYSFSPSTNYEGWASLDSSRCHKFFFFDFYGDGLLYGGGLTLIENGVTVLEVSGSGNTWYHEFGSC